MNVSALKAMTTCNQHKVINKKVLLGVLSSILFLLIWPHSHQLHRISKYVLQLTSRCQVYLDPVMGGHQQRLSACTVVVRKVIGVPDVKLISNNMFLHFLFCNVLMVQFRFLLRRLGNIYMQYCFTDLSVSNDLKNYFTKNMKNTTFEKNLLVSNIAFRNSCHFNYLR